ncbi:SEC-C domain-containing protein [Streptomyces lunaelactis]|nr:SEC-C domain-containing protein [Streptomyces lunaelactis]
MGTKLLRKRGSQTGPVRNRSCVCGSGLKFKRCCGQEGQ